MLKRLHIVIFIAIAAAIWSLTLVAKGTPITKDHFAPFGTVVSGMVIVGALFEKALWHLRWLHGWLVERPDLRGTWRVELKSSWVNPETGKGIPTIICYTGVEQTFSTLNMHLMTPESESWLIADRIFRSPNGKGYQVVGAYRNQPQIQLRDTRSPIHRGAFVLDTHGPAARPTNLNGEYWTDRKSTGRMNFAKRVTEVHTRFEDAERAFETQTGAETGKT